VSAPEPTTPPTTEPYVCIEPDACWLPLDGGHAPDEEACYVDEFGIGTSQYHFVACDAATWPGPVINRTVTEVVACVEGESCWDCSTMGNLICGPGVDAPVATVGVPTQTLPVTGSEGSVALVGGAALLLGILFIRIARS
jgi:hypothetical protein